MRASATDANSVISAQIVHLHADRMQAVLLHHAVGQFLHVRLRTDVVLLFLGLALGLAAGRSAAAGELAAILARMLILLPIGVVEMDVDHSMTQN